MGRPGMTMSSSGEGRGMMMLGVMAGWSVMIKVKDGSEVEFEAWSELDTETV